jgi:hypothetical protein
MNKSIVASLWWTRQANKVNEFNPNELKFISNVGNLVPQFLTLVSSSLVNLSVNFDFWTFYTPFTCWLLMCEHILWFVNFPINFAWCYVCVFWSGLTWSGLVWWSYEPMLFNLFWSGLTWFGLMWFNFQH